MATGFKKVDDGTKLSAQELIDAENKVGIMREVPIIKVSPVNQGSIGMPMKKGRGQSSSLSAAIIKALLMTTAYKNRVEADGGTFENVDYCFSKMLLNLIDPTYNQEGRVLG